MAWNYFYKDRSGAQNGPVSLEELVTLVKAGRIAPDCLVWSEGFQPAPASSYEALAAAFQNRFSSGGAAGGGLLQPAFPAWGLFWRSIVYSLGVWLIVPAPWAGEWFYRWMAGRVALPNGKRLFVETSVGECWFIFAGIGLAAFAPLFFHDKQAHAGVQLIASLASVFLGFLLIGWFSRSLRSEDRAVNVAFEGGFLAYLGWNILIALSFVTIIGWAWVAKYMMRWICRETRGSHQFEFIATGWDILWRTLATVFGCMLIVTIPWLIAWISNWCLSQIVVTPEATSLANADRMAA